MICERDEFVNGLALCNTRKTAVAAFIHPHGADVRFDEMDMREWSWWEMVAQLNEQSIEYVVEDGVLGRGLVGCDIRARRTSYDHQRQVRHPGKDPQLRE